MNGSISGLRTHALALAGALVGGAAPAAASAALVFGPYKDATINMDWNTYVISTKVTGPLQPLTDVLPPGARTVSLAFATGECGSENWGGVPGATLAAANVPALAAANVDYIVSTGGAAGRFTCGSDAGMIAFIERYASPHLIGIDFDVEAGQSRAEIEDLVRRVAAVQPRYPQLRFSFTVGTLASSSPGSVVASSWGANAPDNLNVHGSDVMHAIAATGLRDYTINLMTMDYGSATAGNCVVANGRCDMGESAIQAAMNLHDHWKVPYKQIELTPMIGGNDVIDESFTLADIPTVGDFVRSNALAGLHFWSLDRDTDCPPGWASPTCNTIGGVGNLGYLNAFIAELKR